MDHNLISKKLRPGAQVVVDRTSLLPNRTETEHSKLLPNRTERTEPNRKNRTELKKSYFLQLTARSLEIMTFWYIH